MPSQLSELSPVLVELKVDVPWERVAKNLEDSYAKLQRSARVRGFRPGKVPRNVVKQLFGAQVKSEVTNALVEEGLIAAFKEHSISPVAMPEIDPEEIAEGKPFAFTAKIEVRPKVAEVETALELTRPKEDVSDTEIDAELERLRNENAELRTPEPTRPAKEGDSLLIDTQVSIAGEERPDLSATDKWVELGGNRLIAEIEQGLLGAKPGETRDVFVNFDAEHSREDLRGKIAVFKLTVKEQREKELPALDDEFAKDLGEHETLAALRESIREKLAANAKRRAQSQLREQAMDRLVDKNPIPVPPSLVEQQERMLNYEFAQFAQALGQQIPMTDELRSTMHERAERKVRAAILFGEIARRDTLTVTPSDIDAKLAEIATRTGKNIAKVKVEYQGDKRDALESQILEDKVLELLLSRATIVEEPVANPSVEDGETGS